jgi:hypothetical protein
VQFKVQPHHIPGVAAMNKSAGIVGGSVEIRIGDTYMICYNYLRLSYPIDKTLMNKKSIFNNINGMTVHYLTP